MSSALVDQILDALSQGGGPILTQDTFPDIQFATMKSALDRLGSRELISYKTIEREENVLSEEAKGIVANGSHEARVFEAVRRAVGGLKISDLPVCRPWCMAMSGSCLSEVKQR
jgi:phenylalanyl-tRNA synthetase alpha chain